RASVSSDLVLKLSNLCRTRWQDEVLRIHRTDHVGSRDSAGLHLPGVQIHFPISLLAAIWIRDRSAGDCYQLRTNKVQSVIVELLLRKSLASKTKAQHWDIRRIVTYDQWRRDSHWKLQEDGLGDGGDLGNSGGNVGGRLEKNL